MSQIYKLTILTFGYFYITGFRIALLLYNDNGRHEAEVELYWQRVL